MAMCRTGKILLNIWFILRLKYGLILVSADSLISCQIVLG